MTWDIHPGREQEYFEFVVRTFMPRAAKLGLNLSDAWVTVFGEQPQIMVGAEVESLKKAKEIIESEEWIQLNDRLQDYVDNYHFKLVPLKGAFQF
jgi:hypothetical protein